MKKFLSILLSFAMLLSITTGLNLSAYASDEFADAESIALNSSVKSSLSEMVSEKKYKITTTENGKLTISFSHQQESNSRRWDLYIYQKNSLGTYDIVQEGISSSNQSTYTFVTMGTAPTTYYIKVVGYYNVDGIEYQLSNTFTPTYGEYETEDNSSFETADTLSLNSSIGGSLLSSDSADYYKVSTTEAGKLTISFSHQQESDSRRWDLYVYQKNSLGTYDIVQEGISSSSQSTYTFVTMGTAPTTYYIKVVGYYNVDGIEYQLSNTFTPTYGEYETEDNNSYETADTFSLNSTIGGNSYGSNTEDYYKIITTESGNLTLSFGNNQSTDSGYWKISAYRDNGFEKAVVLKPQSLYKNGSGDRAFTFSVEAGTYYLKLVADYNVTGEEYILQNTFFATPVTTPVVNVPQDTTTFQPIHSTTVSMTKKPKATSISKLTKGKKSFKVTFKKVSSISGYQVQYSTDKKFKKNTKTVNVKKSSTSATVKKLKSKKTYYVRVRTYKTTKVNGKVTKVYSSWSKVKSVKTK